MVNLATSTIRANIFESIYDVLTAAYLSSSLATVTAAYIDDDHSFPQVVVNPAFVPIQKMTFNRTNRMYSADVEIDIFAIKNKQIDQISDEINKNLETSESALASSGLYLMDSEDIGGVTFPLNESTKVHQKTMLITFGVNL